MNKCRITLDLDLATHAHQLALLEWLDELDERFGAPSAEQLAAADALLDEAFGPSDDGASVDPAAPSR